MSKETAQQAGEILIRKFRDQFLHGNKEAIYTAVSELIKVQGKIDQELRQEFVNLASNRWPVAEEDIERISAILSEHDGKSPMEQLSLYVIMAPYELVKTNNGYQDKSEEKARRFAREINLNTLVSENALTILQSGEQRQTYNFGEEIGRISGPSIDFIKAVVQSLADIEEQKQNPAFVLGFLAGTADDTFIRETIDLLLQHHNTERHAVRAGRYLKVMLTDLLKYENVLLRSPETIQNLQYIHAEALPLNEFESYIRWLVKLGEQGYWQALDTIHLALYRNEERWHELKAIVRELVSGANIISFDAGVLIKHTYETIALRLVKEDNDSVLSAYLAEGAVQTFSSHFFRSESLIENLLVNLLEYQWDTVWPILGHYLLEGDIQIADQLIEVLKSFRRYDEEKLLQWAQENKPEGPRRLAAFVEFERSDEEGNVTLTPIIISLLNFYGADERLLSELSSRLHTFSSVGSAMPIFERRKRLAESLLTHPVDEVKDFAKREIGYFENDIEREKRFIENFGLGEF
ncbi:hypothetical protein [Mucilaginibacter defluvii]|uniref:HEAT repeat protein n=1 Tax=Mucilaginibacter defluvii TaxID=1196019 RepID=A0ABP9FTV3_9SPHI